MGPTPKLIKKSGKILTAPTYIAHPVSDVPKRNPQDFFFEVRLVGRNRGVEGAKENPFFFRWSVKRGSSFTGLKSRPDNDRAGKFVYNV